MDSQDDVVALLRRRGIRATNERLAILSILKRCKKPLSISEIAKKLLGKAHQTTVYRTLSGLVEHGLIERLDFAARTPRYEYAGRHHHHIVCDVCGRVEDVETCVPAASMRRIASRSTSFVRISRHRVEYFGTCNDCLSRAR